MSPLGTNCEVGILKLKYEPFSILVESVILNYMAVAASTVCLTLVREFTVMAFVVNYGKFEREPYPITRSNAFLIS